VGTYLEKYYPVKSRNVFYNGIEKLPSKARKTKKICFVARIEEDTNLMGYLKSLAYLKKKYRLNPKLDVYGDGKLRDQCENFARENKLNVQFKGWTHNANKLIIQYKYTFATQFLTTLDAIASRSLVFNLASNNLKKDIADDFLQKGRYGIISSDYKDLAKKFYYYYNNKKEYEKITNKAFDYSKLFLWSNVIDRIFIPVYNRLLK
jgi:glycosyltransferase involved in cell wall biosynthesis